MGAIIDLTGEKFGRLTVIERAGSTKHGAAKWRCVCQCGNETIVIGDELRKHNTTSCGCYAKECSSKRLKGKCPHNKSHGMVGTPVYKEWSEMKRRCNNPNDISYHRYGERGIRVCERWEKSFEAFYSDVSTLPHFGEKGYSLDRIDNNKWYAPDNVRWADAKTQANNRRTSCFVEYNGIKKTIMQWATEYNIPYNRLYKRIRVFKWNIDKALNTP